VIEGKICYIFQGTLTHPFHGLHVDDSANRANFEQFLPLMPPVSENWK
jgi:hypothetical protein